MLQSLLQYPRYFNPRSLAGATCDSSAASSASCSNFNPRSLAGATNMLLRIICKLQAFQSTLPRGSDGVKTILKNLQKISIHAPSRERLKLMPVVVRVTRFQSTLPRGSDDFYWPSFAHLGISIHAPSRERHLALVKQNLANAISIHAPSRERPIFIGRRLLILAFQSTLPRGSDLYILIPPRMLRVFQSTLPRGSDAFFRAPFLDFRISIHAPSRERLARVRLKSKEHNFNPRSLAGATSWR